MIAKKLDYSLSGFIPLIYDPRVWVIKSGDWFIHGWDRTGQRFISTAKSVRIGEL